MKIAPDKLSQLIKRASIWSGSPELEVCELDFGKKGVKMVQINPTHTIAVYLVADRRLFSNYEAIGTVQFPTQKIVDVSSRAFRGDRNINIKIEEREVGEEKARFIVIEGGKENYFKQLPEEDLPTRKLKIEIAKFGILPKGAEITKFYRLSAGLLKDIFDIGGEVYEFKFGDEIIVKSEDWADKNHIAEGYTRKIDFIESWGDGEGTTGIAVDYLDRALTQFSGDLTVGFAGDKKKIFLSKRDAHTAWTYEIAPRGYH